MQLPSLFSVLHLVPSVEAATGATGVEAAMNVIVTMIVALAGVAVVGAIAWRGVQFLLARDFSHIMEGVIGLGVGGGMIAACRTLGTLLVGAAIGMPATGLPPFPLLAQVGEVLGITLWYVPTLSPLIFAYRKVRYGR